MFASGRALKAAEDGSPKMCFPIIPTRIPKLFLAAEHMNRCGRQARRVVAGPWAPTPEYHASLSLLGGWQRVPQLGDQSLSRFESMPMAGPEGQNPGLVLADWEP